MFKITIIKNKNYNKTSFIYLNNYNTYLFGSLSIWLQILVVYIQHYDYIIIKNRKLFKRLKGTNICWKFLIENLN